MLRASRLNSKLTLDLKNSDDVFKLKIRGVDVGCDCLHLFYCCAGVWFASS